MKDHCLLSLVYFSSIIIDHPTHILNRALFCHFNDKKKKPSLILLRICQSQTLWYYNLTKLNSHSKWNLHWPGIEIIFPLQNYTIKFITLQFSEIKKKCCLASLFKSNISFSGICHSWFWHQVILFRVSYLSLTLLAIKESYQETLGNFSWCF